MIKKNFDGHAFYEFEIFQKFGDRVISAVLTKDFDIDDKGYIQRAFGWSHLPVAFKQQLSGTDSHILKSVKIPEDLFGDGFITQEKNLPIMTRAADCGNIVIFDPCKNVIANIHAGWRGLAGKIIHSVIGKMRERFECKSENLIAAISPMIGPCCYKFSHPEELPNFMHRHLSEENILDLWAATEGQLCEAGIMEENIENPRVCTFCNPEEFYSYRRNKSIEKRFGTLIMLK
ncbi:MAG: polyphenol oxidase family protein [Candidatus Gracilibacteria bacterium]